MSNYNFYSNDSLYYSPPSRTLSETDLKDLFEPLVDLTLFQDLSPSAVEASSPKTTDSLSDNDSSPHSQYTSFLKDPELVIHEPPNDFFLNYLTCDMPPEKPLYTNEESNRPQIRILGVPSTGAKSRVETQIKLCIQLMTKDEKKVVDWSYIRLGENMLARSRLRKSQQQVKPLDGSIATMVSDESKVLQLEAKVICASSSNTDHPVRMCVGCVRRERKRAERTKDGKSKDLVVLSQDMEAERDRILLFNCNPMINFSSGDAILPTRITCYCRHHNEKEGFRICFAMKNHQGHVVATGISPPIMITDDHKSSKQKNSRKRSRDENTHIISRPDTPAPSRRGSMSTGEEKNTLTSLSLEDGEDSEEEQ
ncbi:hypothetical protein CU098_001083, partial [Rhizopus stolonifer]